MEFRSISDCLNFIDNLILCNTSKYIGIGNLEDLLEYIINMYDGKYVEDLMTILGIVYQINIIIDKFYLDNESDINQLYRDLRKRILVWLKEHNTNSKDDDDE